MCGGPVRANSPINASSVVPVLSNADSKILIFMPWSSRAAVPCSCVMRDITAGGGDNQANERGEGDVCRSDFLDRVLLERRWSEDRHVHEPLRPRIANRMDDSGRSKGRVANGQTLRLIADLNHAAAFQNEVQLVLVLMRVRGVFLTRLKAVQPGKEEIPLHQGALSHLFGCELRKAGDSLYEHDSQSKWLPVKRLGQSCRRSVR